MCGLCGCIACMSAAERSWWMPVLPVSADFKADREKL